MFTNKKYRAILRSIGVGLAVLFALVVYAYGFQVTKVNLEETRSPRRQEQLVRILRALARPDIFTYDKIEVRVEQPIMVPCPAEGFVPPSVDPDEPYLVVEPSCAAPGETVTISGFNFEPNTRGPIAFIPPSEVTLQLGTMEVDANGQFRVEVKLPKRSEEVVQYIRATTRENVGPPKLTKTALDTWEKIVETIFLALLATTIGTILGVPLSFFAAKNIMRDVKSPLISIALNILSIPVAILIGINITKVINDLTTRFVFSGWGELVGFILGPLLFVLVFRWAVPAVEDQSPTLGLRVARVASLLLSSTLLVTSLKFLSNLTIRAGDFLMPRLGGWSFIGKFVRDLGDILGMLLVVLVAAAIAGIFSNIADRIGKKIAYKLPVIPAKVITMVITTTAFASLLILIMAGINWFYQLNNPVVLYWYPGGIGALLGLATSIKLAPKDDLPVGIVIYYVSRTIWNGLRSIEALVWVIVFVVWVGIGPFAGVLALSLHTIAALTKLYSEQVESIMPGPLEAITATGANRLQTIVYAVIPQIIPPYISFTMYRWDINVRMSTIIGFAGGGGIGFLLYQNINLLNYRAASAQMLAIAIVVAAMDYLSSKMREKFV